MQKPYNISAVSDKKSIELLDNLFTILFKGVQGREIKTLEFAATGVWPTVAMLAEKEIVFAVNAVDGVRLYTKIAGVLKFVAFT